MHHSTKRVGERRETGKVDQGPVLPSPKARTTNKMNNSGLNPWEEPSFPQTDSNSIGGIAELPHLFMFDFVTVLIVLA